MGEHLFVHGRSSDSPHLVVTIKVPDGSHPTVSRVTL
jgi:hypothetical protein